MEKKAKPKKFLKNRVWKSGITNRLRGAPREIVADYWRGVIDSYRGRMRKMRV